MAARDGQLRLAASLQGALTEAEVTKAYLDVVPDLIGARGRGFYRLDAAGSPSAVVADVSADFLAEYEERGRAGDPVLDFVQAAQRPVDDTRACSVAQWHDSAAHDVLRGAGFYHSMEAPVIASGKFIGTINFARARNDLPFGINEMRTAGQAAEQLGIAVQRALRFEQSGARASLLETVLDRLPQAVVVTDLDGQVIFANQAAAPFLTGGNRPPGPPRLEFTSPRLSSGQRVAFASDETVAVKSVRLPAEAGATLTLIYPRGDAELPLWDILSPREQQIADWVAQGLTTKQISERAVVSQNTVKQHLKRIFAKADVANRAELVQRVWANRQASSPR
jgi:DNA-binding CsgD family transcriptional regulator/PAS domain-containing protein